MNKKEQLFNAVLNLTANQGLWDTPMSKIANYANMAVGSIYHHFTSKEQLLIALYLKTQAQIGEVLTPLPQFDSHQQEFYRLFNEAYSFLVNNPYVYKYAAQVGNAPLLSKIDKEKVESFFAPFTLFFENGINQGVIEPGNALLIAKFTLAQIQTLAKTQLEGELHVTAILQKQLVDRCWTAIKK
jgi:AcrR family transcriptional regulator